MLRNAWLLVLIALAALCGATAWRAAARRTHAAPAVIDVAAANPDMLLARAPERPATPVALAGAAADPALPRFPGAVVCLDPGHPSETNSGRTVQNGVTELDMNWQVAQKLKGALEKHGITVVLTRTDKDKTVTNRERAEIANRAHAALFLRLHCDTQSGRATRRGFTLYYPDGQGTKSGVTGPPRAMREQSLAAAEALRKGMAPGLQGKLPDNGILGESKTYVGGRQGALTGSIFATVPAVTVEMVYLSHPADAAFIKSPAGQALLADALRAGVAAYLAGLAPGL